MSRHGKVGDDRHSRHTQKKEPEATGCAIPGHIQRTSAPRSSLDPRVGLLPVLVEDGGHAPDLAHGVSAATARRRTVFNSFRPRIAHCCCKPNEIVRHGRRASFCLQALRLVDEVLPALMVVPPMPLPCLDNALPLPLVAFA